MIADPQTFDRMKQDARRDDWHRCFVGSDIRQMLGEIERLRAALLNIEDAPYTMVNDSDSLRHTIRGMQAMARAARES